MKVCLISIGFMALSVSLSAVLVTVNPDDFAAGTDISHAWSGVTLSSGGGASGLDGKVYTAASLYVPPGNLVFAHNSIPSSGSNNLWRNYERNSYYLRVDFATPTNRVLIDFISDSGTDYHSLWYYTTAGVLERSQGFVSLIAGERRTIEISRPTADISYIRVGGYGSTDQFAVLLDNLRFEIPEPATFLILLPGLLLFKSRRKQGL